ncbi:uncharacterized protein LOC108041815 [Drosophila rhopaloa]|uniref:Transcription factor BTF3 n=1 Tax=Drosophila rhopaloa TaxID=1041015 RepID=A0ABM5H6G5_DRORH|nr:uncharacterized protein LOC108041815 [Drosophila rhopaloa]
MDQNKLKKMEDAVRIGGKGSVRRKHKHIQTSAAMEEKRLQTALTKLPLNQMPGIQEISLELEDTSEIQVMMPKVQGSVMSSLFVITGDLVRNPPLNPPTHQPQSSYSDTMDLSRSPDPIVEEQAPKKAKKPRNRLRYRNKRAQEMLAMAQQAGDNASKARREGLASVGNQDLQGGGDSQPMDKCSVCNQEHFIESPNQEHSKKGSNKEHSEDNSNLDLSEDGSNVSVDSDKTQVPSDVDIDSDMDQTLVGDNDSLDGRDIPTESDELESNGAESDGQDQDEVETEDEKLDFLTFSADTLFIYED